MHAPAAQQEGYLRGLLTAVDTRWWATPRIVDGVDLAKLDLELELRLYAFAVMHGAQYARSYSYSNTHSVTSYTYMYGFGLWYSTRVP